MLTSPSPWAFRDFSQSSVLAGQGRPIVFHNRPPKKSGVEPLTLRNIWRPWKSFRLSWTFSSVRAAAADLYIRRAFPLMGASLFATVAVIASLATTPARAGDASWLLSPPNEDFNDPVNWGPPPTGAVGVPTGHRVLWRVEPEQLRNRGQYDLQMNPALTQLDARELHNRRWLCWTSYSYI